MISCVKCGAPQKARSLCQHHYNKLRRSGQLDRVQQTRTDVLKRDRKGRKLCIGCREWRPESEYSNNATRKDGLAPYCRPCVKYTWVAQECDKRYGLPPGTVRSILERQMFRCAICRVPIDDSAHVDHDHACCPSRGKACGRCVRGVLCKPCNMLLGNVDDSIETLAAAIEYLKEWGK